MVLMDGLLTSLSKKIVWSVVHLCLAVWDAESIQIWSLGARICYLLCVPYILLSTLRQYYIQVYRDLVHITHCHANWKLSVLVIMPRFCFQRLYLLLVSYHFLLKTVLSFRHLSTAYLTDSCNHFACSGWWTTEEGSSIVRKVWMYFPKWRPYPIGYIDGIYWLCWIQKKD